MNLKKEITCYILLDGFKADYIKDTKFIKDIKKEYISKIEESFGFQSFRPSAFAGINPERSNICHIWFYSPDTTPYGKFKLLLNVMNKIKSKKINILIRKLFLFLYMPGRFMHRNYYLSLYDPVDILFNLMPYFDISEKKTVIERDYINFPTIFDLLKEQNKKFLYLGYPIKVFGIKEKNKKIEQVLKNAEDLDFIFLHVNISDIFGHVYGPNSKELKELHKYEDFFVEKVYSYLKSKYNIVNLIIGGDHGMVKVTNTINLWEKLQNLSVKLEKDYLVFLDSPMARFWVFNEKAEMEIREILERLECGKILIEEDYEKYKIRFEDNRYGDLIWLANPGTLIFPNFFGWYEPVKGMHGYAPECEDNKGAFMIITDKNMEFEKRENLKMIDVFPTLCDMMNLPIPKTCEGKSIIKQK